MPAIRSIDCGFFACEHRSVDQRKDRACAADHGRAPGRSVPIIARDDQGKRKGIERLVFAHETEIGCRPVVTKDGRSAVRVDAALVVEHRVLVRVIHGTAPNELRDQRGLASMAATGG